MVKRSLGSKIKAFVVGNLRDPLTFRDYTLYRQCIDDIKTYYSIDKKGDKEELLKIKLEDKEIENQLMFLYVSYLFSLEFVDRFIYQGANKDFYLRVGEDILYLDNNKNINIIYINYGEDNLSKERIKVFSSKSIKEIKDWIYNYIDSYFSIWEALAYRYV